MTEMKNIRTLLKNDCKATLEMYMALSGKAAECLNDLQTCEICDLDSLGTAPDNVFLPSNYVTTLLFEFRTRKF